MAKLEVPIGAAGHFFMLHSMFDLMPQKLDVTTFYSKSRGAFECARAMGVDLETHFVPSNHSLTCKRKWGKEAPRERAPSELQFNYPMGSMLALLLPLAYWAKNPHQSEKMKKATHGILKRVCHSCPLGAVVAGLELVPGGVRRGGVLEVFGRLGLVEKWSKERQLPLAPLQGDPDGPIPLEDVLFITFKTQGESEQARPTLSYSSKIEMHAEFGGQTPFKSLPPSPSFAPLPGRRPCQYIGLT